jgi:nucleotide-binding universal stress UspA family protein
VHQIIADNYFVAQVEVHMKILILYDGTIQSKTALQYGLSKAREKSGEVVLLQVFQSGLFVDYDAGPRAEEIVRSEAARHLKDAETIIRGKGQGVAVRIVSEEGDPEEQLLHTAMTEHADLVLASPRYKAVIKKAPCPVYIIPGTILVPVDNSESLLADKENIIQEARATGSNILLMGVIPLHLYSPAEKQELEQIKKGTAATVRRIKNALSEQGVNVSEIIRSGYPDEEILKAAEEYSVSLIILPTGGKTPSELTKAAAILLDEPERLHMPVQLLQELG